MASRTRATFLLGLLGGPLAYSYVPQMLSLRRTHAFSRRIIAPIENTHAATSRRRHSPVVPIAQHRAASTTPNQADEDEKPFNPYADPNYPDLEFVNYDDPEYAVDQGTGDSFDDSTEAQIEEMRNERRRRNDEFQFQTYYRDILKGGQSFKGEWTVYRSSTFADEDSLTASQQQGGSLPQLVPHHPPLHVVSRGIKTGAQLGALYNVEGEAIMHEERLVTGTNDEHDGLEMGSGDIETTTHATTLWHDLVTKRYAPEFLTVRDFRGHQGNQCVGAAYTISYATPIHSPPAAGKGDDDDKHLGPFEEYRTEVGLTVQNMRFRIKLDYAREPTDVVSAFSAHPPLHLKTLIVCREMLNSWPQLSFVDNNSNFLAPSTLSSSTHDAFFGTPGAPGGLYDPPPMGGGMQANKYMMLDVPGHATLLFPFVLDQEGESTTTPLLGWVTSLDWTAGLMRYQVDRKVQGGQRLLGLRTLELSEVQSMSAHDYRPQDGGQDMRQ